MKPTAVGPGSIQASMARAERHVRALCTVLLALGLAGCAAAIIGSGTPEDEIIRAGATELQLTQQLGAPLSREAVSPPRRAWDLRDGDAGVSLLVYPSYGFDAARGSYPIPPEDTAVTAATFRFSGRVGRDDRASQPGFDSFMTLGLAEIYLVPMALRERARERGVRLMVWFDAAGRALAYKWMPVQDQRP